MNSSDLFSNTEVASLCLLDRHRTEAFQKAIAAVVRPGDVVVDAGAGSGILSFFAARAGAARVVAVEAVPALGELLRDNVRRNRLERVIEVVHGDARDVELPHGVDVVIAELIDTWLLDELQLPVLARLRRDRVIGPNTRLVPQSYDGWAAVGQADFDSYGVDLRFPHHDWPDLDEEGGWLEIPFRPLADPVRVFRIDFRSAAEELGPVSLVVNPTRSGVANAVRLTGEVDLGAGVRLGATPSFNGAKLLPIAETALRRGQLARCELSRSPKARGLASFRLTQTFRTGEGGA